jgi:PAS domain S-box-containing protein
MENNLMTGKPTYEELEQRVKGLEKEAAQRMQAEKALRESEEKCRTVLEANPDPVVVYDKEGKVIYFNPAFTRVLGWTLEECFGKKMDVFVPDEDWPETKKMLGKVLTGERLSGFETQRYTKEGNIIPVSISGAVYRDWNGGLVGSVINLRDISEQKRLESQLIQAHKMEAIATIAGGIAHEFNNTLVGIIGNIDLLQMNFPDDETISKYIKVMKASSLRMVDLTNKLLAYAREGKYQSKIISINDVVRETLSLTWHTINSSIQVETDLHRDISDIKADLTQMQMVLSAMLSNASEAIEDKGRIRIITREEEIDEEYAKNHSGLKPGYYVCLMVEDDGRGMDEETRSKVFEPFFTTKHHGRGLGMAAAYGIIKNHDGWISVDSELGKGAVARIYLSAVKV